MSYRRIGTSALAALVAGLLAVRAHAQGAPPSQLVPLVIDSGWVASPSAQTMVVASFPVVVDGAEWMRLHFSDVSLAGDVLAGTGSILRITSLQDGAVQELNAIHVQQWRRTSAYFNGDAVLVEVVAQPGPGMNRVQLAEVTASVPVALPESICGATDDRVLSNDPRCGRLLPIGCTGWILDDCNSCQLTAGHCSSTPLDLDVLEFNVPLSSSTGAIQHPPPQDQYAVDDSSTQSTGAVGAGAEFAHFGCFPNSMTGLTPYEAQGQRFTFSAPPPFVSGAVLRVTGFGARVAPPTYNEVQQTDVGPWVSDAGTTLGYQVDTTGGQSGAPILFEATGDAIGIHTHAGCGDNGGLPVGQNAGTSWTHSGLQAALANPQGVCAAGVYVVGALPRTLPVGGAATPVTIQIAGPFVPGSVQLHYSYDGGPFQTVAMTPGVANLFSASLPSPSCGDDPRFYFSVDHATCGVLTRPAGAPAAYFSAAPQRFEVSLRSEDFETDSGWTTSDSGVSAGWWERGAPVDDPSWAYDPVSDADGSGQCWLTQNALGNTDVDGGSVTLMSPALDLAGGSCEIRYSYYLNLTAGDGSDTLQVEVSSNGVAGPWTVVANHSTSGGLSWRAVTLSSADLESAGVTFTGDMRVRFVATDAAIASIVEAGVDAFEVVRSSCTQFDNFCVSGASGSHISATGSASLAANDLALHASQVPSNRNGLFFYSLAKQNVPFGLGVRCVGAPAVRLPIVNSGAGSTLDWPLDYGLLPDGGPIAAGDLWNFQCWFHTGLGQTDMSDALQIIFTP